MRVVFDSNIYISALVIPGSQAERAFLKIVDGRDALLISKAIIDEVLTVLSRKFSNEPDNRILECAFAGKADLIVTGDKEMLKLRQYCSSRIISLKEYAADA